MLSVPRENSNALVLQVEKQHSVAKPDLANHVALCSIPETSFQILIHQGPTIDFIL